MTAFSWRNAHGRIDVDGQLLEYRSYGPDPESGPTLVLLHEGLGSAGLWGTFPERLVETTNCGVFAYSRAGYGHSSPARLPRPIDYMHREAWEVLPRVLATIGLRRGVLIGHSDGASIATLYLGARQDHRVRGLALIAPHFFVEDITIRSIELAKADYEMGSLRGRLSRWHADVDNAFRGWNDAWLDPAFRAWDITNCLDYLRVPIAIVQGTSDQYGTTRQIDVAVERCTAPLEVTLIEGVGHAPHREAPDALIAALQSFLAHLEAHEGRGFVTATRSAHAR